MKINIKNNGTVKFYDLPFFTYFVLPEHKSILYIKSNDRQAWRLCDSRLDLLPIHPQDLTIPVDIESINLVLR